VTPRNKINVWSSLQYSCLHCIEGGDGTGLGFGAAVSSPEASSTNENHPSMLTQVSWSSPVTNRLLLETNAQLGPYFWWGSRQKNAFDTTLIQVQENGGATLHELAAEYGVSAERIRQIEQKAMQKMKGLLAVA